MGRVHPETFDQAWGVVGLRFKEDARLGRGEGAPQKETHPIIVGVSNDRGRCQ